jgi:hypothetical protein
MWSIHEVGLAQVTDDLFPYPNCAGGVYSCQPQQFSPQASYRHPPPKRKRSIVPIADAGLSGRLPDALPGRYRRDRSLIFGMPSWINSPW